jgi:hypothetical protein
MVLAIVWGIVGLAAPLAMHCPLAMTVIITVVASAVGAVGWRTGEAAIALGALGAIGWFLWHGYRELLPPFIATVVILAVASAGLLYSAMKLADRADWRDVKNSRKITQNRRLTHPSQAIIAVGEREDETMNHPIPMNSGDEIAALSPERRVLIWKAGDRKKAKRSYARRVRRDGRRIARIYLEEQ